MHTRGFINILVPFLRGRGVFTDCMYKTGVEGQGFNVFFWSYIINHWKFCMISKKAKEFMLVKKECFSFNVSRSTNMWNNVTTLDHAHRCLIYSLLSRRGLANYKKDLCWWGKNVFWLTSKPFPAYKRRDVFLSFYNSFYCVF